MVMRMPLGSFRPKENVRVFFAEPHPTNNAARWRVPIYNSKTTTDWNRGTSSKFLPKVEKASRFQPILDEGRWSKKQRLGRKPQDMLT